MRAAQDLHSKDCWLASGWPALLRKRATIFDKVRRKDGTDLIVSIHDWHCTAWLWMVYFMHQRKYFS
jgi:hypothetical protein